MKRYLIGLGIGLASALATIGVIQLAGNLEQVQAGVRSPLGR